MSDELNDYNPKLDRLRRPGRKSLAFKMADIDNFFGLEIKDPEKVRRLYSRWPLIPYAGTHEVSNDGLLLFFDAAKFISPTQGACHNAIKFFLFGEKLEIVKAKDPDFRIDEDDEPVEPQLKKDYAAFIKSIKHESGTITKAACDFYEELASNGNIFVELVHTVTAGVKSSAFYHHPTQHCKYWATLKGEPMMVLISELFTDDYFRRHKPKVLPLYPNYAQEDDGTMRTIIHIKNGKFKYYGRPLWAGAYIDIYSEAKEREYLTKIAAANFTGQGVMEVEDDDIETDGFTRDNEDAIDEGYGGVADRFDRNFTAESDDPQTFLFMTRPHGAKPVFIYEFKLNTNENFYKTVGGIHRNAIIENNSWSERLLGNAVAEGFSKDNYIAEARVKGVSVLSFYSGYVRDAMDLIFTECAKWQEREDFAGLGVEVPSAIDELLALKEGEFKDLLTAYGTAVRAGAITSTEEDEAFFRQRLGISPINEHVLEAWQEDGGYRRPITLKTSEDSEAQQSLEQ
jgi:hypothetical protein